MAKCESIRSLLFMGLLFSPLLSQDVSSAVVTAAGSTQARTESVRWADVININDYGAQPGNSAANNNALINALANYSYVYIPNGIYQFSAVIPVSSGKMIFGPGTMHFSFGGLQLSSRSTIKDITIQGDTNGSSDLVSSQNSSYVTINNITLCNARFNGICLSNVTNSDILNCTIDTCGCAGMTNVTWQGNGIYLGSCSLIRINNCKISHTYGSAGIMFADTNKISILNNYIFETCFRGIEGWDDGSGSFGEIFISTNRLEKIGELNTTESGVGSNGIAIFSNRMDLGDCIVSNNYLNAIVENGIEVSSGGVVSNNTIVNTGYKNLTTPSKEGIFIGPRSKVINNNIRLTGGISIRVYISSTDGVFSGSSGPFEIRSNTCKVPGTPYCISVWANGPALQFCQVAITDNELFSGSIQVTATSGASFDSTSTRIYRNSTYTSISPSIDASITRIENNSFNSSY